MYIKTIEIPITSSSVTYYVPVVKKCRIKKAVIAASGTLDSADTMTITDGTTTSHTFTIPAACTAGTQVTAANTDGDVLYDITDNFVIATNANAASTCTAYLTLELDEFARTDANYN